jgi:hypothetical protein
MNVFPALLLGALVNFSLVVPDIVLDGAFGVPA